MTSKKITSARKMKKPATNVMTELDEVAGDRDAAMSYAVLLLLSGAPALIYQVLWARQLTLVVGVEVYSITVAVSAFFAGLAAGGAVFGRLADRVGNPLRV
jgi:spermidine synthase